MMRMLRSTRALGIGMLSLGLVALFGATAQAQPGLDPASVDATILPGGSISLTKTVTTPEVPPTPDIVFLADTTGSMGSAIASVQGSIGPIMTQVVAAAPDAQFGAAQYKDFNCDAVPFNLDQALTANTAAVSAAVGTWVASGGCDTPEAQLNALSVLSGAATGWRTGSTRIIVWFGDAPGHDPSNGHTLASTVADLNSASIEVIAISVGANQLDATGQATAITTATGGVLLSGVNANATAAAIIEGLTSLPVTVSMTSDCAAPISTSFVPASQVVTSGEDAEFTETISVSADAAHGVYECDDWALIDGKPMTDAAGNVIKEHKVIRVTDRMTGGGSVFDDDGTRVTHGFELHCDPTRLPNNLEVNWGKGNRFHLTELRTATCSDDPAESEGQPVAGFDTFKGTGVGTYNGEAGATIRFEFRDFGEPGKGTDHVRIQITDSGGVVVLTVSGFLDSGNQQAH